MDFRENFHFTVVQMRTVKMYRAGIFENNLAKPGI
jgi:hypothetical protein